jgi:hypothetical protein
MRLDPAVAFVAPDEPAFIVSAPQFMIWRDIIPRVSQVGIKGVGVAPRVLAGFDVDHATGFLSVRNICFMCFARLGVVRHGVLAGLVLGSMIALPAQIDPGLVALEA